MDADLDPRLVGRLETELARIPAPAPRPLAPRRGLGLFGALAVAVVVVLVAGLAGRELAIVRTPAATASGTVACPTTSTRDASGVIVSSGDLGLIGIRPADFPGEKLIDLVRPGSALGDQLLITATRAIDGTEGPTFSTPATARTTSWGSVVFEANSKPLGNQGCWRLTRAGVVGDPGIVIDLDRGSSPLAPPSSSTVAATAVPTAGVSPAPRATRLALSDGRLVSDNRPQLLFQLATETRLRAVRWDDATSGVLAGQVPSKATVWQSPDGKRYVLNGKVYDADGHDLGALPWQDKSLPTWSRDGQFLCQAVPETRQNGAAMQLQTVVPGQQPRIVATGYGIYSDNAGYPVLACDATSDRVIVGSFGQGLFAGRLWVFRLSTGALLRSEAIGANMASSWLVASADGTLLAHSVRATNGDSPTTTVRTAEDPAALQTLPNFEAHGFSGDGSLLVGLSGGLNSVAIVDWRSARRTWSATGTPYGGYFPEPSGARVAIGLGFVGGSEDKGDVYLVSADGTSILLPSGVHVALR